MHNFHLQGPGVNRYSSIGAFESQVWVVTLKKGVYRYFCDAHRTTMRGSFRVT